MKRILLVEDNPEIQVFVSSLLRDYLVVAASNLAEAKLELERNSFSLVLLDIELPDGDGIAFFSMIRDDDRFAEIPVIVITAKTETSKKVIAFSLGVDDFITKPLDPAELKARCEARIKKAEKYNQPNQSFSFRDLVLNTTQQRAWIKSLNGKLLPVTLTALEYRLLWCFIRSPERVFSREVLLEEVWGNDTFVNDRTVDTHVSHLRKKLNQSTVVFETMKGEGYRLTTPSMNETARPLYS